MRAHVGFIRTQATTIAKAANAANSVCACGGRSHKALSTSIKVHAALDAEIQADDKIIHRDLRREAHERRCESSISVALAALFFTG